MTTDPKGYAVLLLCLGFALSAAISAATPVRFDVEPRSGSARIMLAHHFDMCARRGLDPWSPTACPYWSPIVRGRVVELAGRFCVFASWSPNAVHHSALNIPRGARPLRYLVRPNRIPVGNRCR